MRNAKVTASNGASAVFNEGFGTTILNNVMVAGPTVNTDGGVLKIFGSYSATYEPIPNGSY
jgi:hypothetical protein